MGAPSSRNAAITVELVVRQLAQVIAHKVICFEELPGSMIPLCTDRSTMKLLSRSALVGAQP